MSCNIYIFGDLHFPRGGASANYVELLAQALSIQNMNVCVISTGNKQATDEDYNNLKRHSIRFSEIIPSAQKINRHMELNYRMGKLIEEKILEDDPVGKVVLIAYNTNPYTLKHMFSFAKRNRMIICGCITEKLPREMFSINIRGYFEYKKYIRATTKILPKFDLVLPISRYLEAFYKKKRANTFLLPILAEVDKIPLYSSKRGGKRKFIIPASGKMKDEFTSALKGFIEIHKELEDKIELHVTGYSDEQVALLCPESKLLINKSIFCHGWLKYNELMLLYDKMDFLVIARKTNQMTLANFPSKVPEVMCHGVIPVVSKVGDYTDLLLVDNVNSFIFSGCDYKQCAAALKKAAMMDATKRMEMSSNAIETVKEKLNPCEWGEKLASMLERI